jgi:hypothetical protein
MFLHTKVAALHIGSDNNLVQLLARLFKLVLWRTELTPNVSGEGKYLSQRQQSDLNGKDIHPSMPRYLDLCVPEDVLRQP